MERSEPALIPEWLKSNGSISGSNHNHNHSANQNQNQHSLSSSFHSDGRANGNHTRRNYNFSSGGYDSPRSVISDPSFFSRKSGSNGSVMHDKNSHLRPCNSFGRNRHDRDWDADPFDFSNKERWFQGDRRGSYSNSTPFGVSTNSLKNGIEKTKLRRSQSVISGKQDETWSKLKVNDARNHHKNGSNDAGNTVSGSTQNTSKDHPSIEPEERPTTPNIARVSSPVLSSSAPSFPVDALPVVGRDGWNSALADMPVGAGSNSMLNASVQESAPASVSTVASTICNGLSMAETLAQVPTRTHSAPQIPVDTQRLEELAIKQSRQLIPVTSMPTRTSVLKQERSKLKPFSRSEMTTALKSGHQQLNHSSRGGSAKSDGAPGHSGKLFILRSAQERNGISSGDKDRPTNFDSAANNPSVVSPAVAHVRGLNNPNHTATEHKASSHPTSYAPTVEKRPTAFQAQSRNDFFKLMREKSATNLSSAPADSKCMESTVLKTTDTTDVTLRVNDDPVLSDISSHDWSACNEANMADSCDALKESITVNNKEMQSIPFEEVHLEEEERRFLCSLGWDENAGEDEGLTEEEINAFNISYKEHMQMKPALKLNCSFWQPQRLSPFISHLDSFDSAESSSSDSDSDSDA